jgi:indolepyruvate decarboxylase
MRTAQTKHMTTIGEFLIRRLKEAGVRHLFGVPGDFNLVFLEQVQADPELQWIGNCNELNGAYAADGYARVNGIGALLTTYGVGELSAINGIAGAYSERVPVVAITGAPPLAQMNSGALLHHTLADGNFENMMACMRQFTAAQARLTPQNAAGEIDRCLSICLTEKRPVYLQLPCDLPLIEIQSTENKIGPAYHSDRALLDEFVSRVLSRLRKATLPVVLVDADVDRLQLTSQLMEFLDTSHLPVALLSTSKGIVSDEHPQYLGIYSGAASREHVRNAIESSDCLITLGVRWTDATTGAFTHSVDPGTEIKIGDWYGRIGGEDFCGISMNDVLGRLSLELRNQPRPAHAIAKPPAVAAAPPQGPEQLSHAVFWRRMAEFVRAGDVLIAENGTPLSGIMGTPLPADVRAISQPIWGAIGYTLPAALGSALAAPERRHLLFIGDGSLQVTVQELSTIFRYGAHPVIFLLNNDGYTIERLILGEASEYNDVQPWRYSDLCGVFANGTAFHRFRVETPEELDSVLRDCETPKECLFVEVMLPRMDAPPLLKALGPVFARQDYGIKWEMQGFPGGHPAGDVFRRK